MTMMMIIDTEVENIMIMMMVIGRYYDNDDDDYDYRQNNMMSMGIYRGGRYGMYS